MSYPEAQATLSMMSCDVRSANNHVKIAQATQQVGQIIHDHNLRKPVISSPTPHLCLHVDGGHIKDKEKDKRSFDAMVATVFRPDAILKINDHQKLIERKHTTASALNDNGNTINTLTLHACQKEGLTSNTTLTAFCDGAANCWNVIDSLQPHCGQIIKSLFS